MRHRTERHGRKFHLDKKNAKISGVCAGIADHFGWDVTVVRVLWVVATILSGFWPMIVAYIVAAWMVDAKPADYAYAEARAEIDETRREASRHPHRAYRISHVKDRFGHEEDR